LKSPSGANSVLAHTAIPPDGHDELWGSAGFPIECFAIPSAQTATEKTIPHAYGFAVKKVFYLITS